MGFILFIIVFCFWGFGSPIQAGTVTDVGLNNLTGWVKSDYDPTAGEIVETNHVIEGKPAVFLKTVSNDPLIITKDVPLSDNVRLTVDFYDDLSQVFGTFISFRNKDLANVPQVSVGVKQTQFGDTYFLRIGDDTLPDLTKPDVSSQIKRTQGWHTLAMTITPQGGFASIDKIPLSYLPFIPNVAKGFTEQKFSVNQILIVNTWKAGLSYYANALIETPALEPFPGTISALHHRLNTFLSQYSAFPEAAYWHRGEFKNADGSAFTGIDWYTPQGLARFNAAYALAAAIEWKHTGKTIYKDEAINALDAAVIHEMYFEWWRAGSVVYNTVTFPIIKATWVLWDDLSIDLKQKAKALIVNELNFYASHLPFNRSGEANGDSAAEENSWLAEDLWLGSVLFSNHPNAAWWKEKADLFAYHSLTTGESFGGVTTQTLSPGFFIINHGMRNMSYQLVSTGQLTNQIMLANRLQLPINSEVWLHNVLPVFKAVEPAIDPTTFNFKDNPPGTWPLATNRGGKDEHGLDAAYHLNALYFLQQKGMTSASWFDEIIKRNWYLGNEYAAMPLNGSYCQAYASETACEWKVAGLTDPTIFAATKRNVDLNEFRKSVYNEVVAGERDSSLLLAIDMSLTLPQLPLTYPQPVTAYPNPPVSAFETTTPRIQQLLTSESLTHYRSFHFPASPTTNLTSWQDTVSGERRVRFYFYDVFDTVNLSNNTPDGFNFGWQNVDKSYGLAFEIRTGLPTTSCATIINKAMTTVECYGVRAGLQTTTNETATQIPRLKGWHYIDFYKDVDTYVMVIDGYKPYRIPASQNLTQFFIASSNWSMPIDAEVVLVNLGTDTITPPPPPLEDIDSDGDVDFMDLHRETFSFFTDLFMKIRLIYDHFGTFQGT